jgi:hypothetical protein
VLEVKKAEHNHAPSLDPRTHHAYRKRTQEQKDKIQADTRAGVAPKTILNSIHHDDPDTYMWLVISGMSVRHPGLSFTRS